MCGASAALPFRHAVSASINCSGSFFARLRQRVNLGIRFADASRIYDNVPVVTLQDLVFHSSQWCQCSGLPNEYRPSCHPKRPASSGQAFPVRLSWQTFPAGFGPFRSTRTSRACARFWYSCAVRSGTRTTPAITTSRRSVAVPFTTCRACAFVYARESGSLPNFARNAALFI